MLGITTTNARVGGFRGGILAEAKTIYNRIIADGGVSNLTRLNFFVKGLKTIYGSLANVPVCYDAHWIGYKLGSGTGATAGQAAAKLYSLTVAGDAVQTTAASQPLLLSHNGADNYWYGPKVNNNNCTTPSSANCNITGDFEFILNLSMNNVADEGMMASKADTSGQYSYYAYYVGNQTINFVFSTNGTAFTTVQSSAFGFVNKTLTWVKISRSGTTLTFSKSLDGINYTQINQVASGSTAFFSGSNSLTIGGGLNNTYSFGGKIYRVTLAKSLGGTPVVDFNPATYNASTSQTAWTSATGEVWTINTGTATSGYKGVLVDRTIVQGDGVDDGMESDTLNISYPRTQFSAFKLLHINNTSGSISDGTQYAGSATYPTRLGFNNNTFLFYAGVNSVSAFDNVLSTKLYTSIYNSTAAENLLNNSPQIASFATIPNNIVKFRLLFSALGAQRGNFNINTIIISNSVNTANNTATYNLIRSLNNNAF
jgi:hypothetical protein